MDPYSRQVIKVSKLVNIEYGNHHAHPLASKNGWLLIGGDRFDVFFYNPFTDDCIDLGFSLVDIKDTINVDPTSPNWELFMRATYHTTVGNYIGIETYTSSGLMSWAHVPIGDDEHFTSMLYMKGNIYCLSHIGLLRRYCVEDGAWDILTSGFPALGDIYEGNCWLLEMNENLVAVHLYYEEDMIDKWEIFKLDWSKMCWVVENSLKSCAIYITDDIAFSTQLTNQYGEKLEGMKLFHHGYDYAAGGMELKYNCYSLSNAEGARVLQSEEYGWITGHDVCHFSFIEPPYFRS